MKTYLIALAAILLSIQTQAQQKPAMHLNALEYLENQGVNIMLAQDYYPEGHQGGVGIIQQGQRVATNGDIRLDPTPGQWSPIPKVGERSVDKTKQEISVRMSYPDPANDRKGFNPITYPDLKCSYTIRVTPAGQGFRIIVDFDKPLPDEYIGKVGFNLELFPGALFGKEYYMDHQFGIFPRQSYDQMIRDKEGDWQVQPIAKGHKLTIAPESETQRMTIENLNDNDLMLLDGRGKYTNGWFVVRSLVPKGATSNAIQWLVTPHAVPGWRSDPVVQVSQVGYHPAQQKVAVIELDAHDTRRFPAELLRTKPDGTTETVLKSQPKDWGKFLRYNYLQFDFSKANQPGMYTVQYGNYRSNPFQISEEVFKEDVWQPTLEYFLPVQMCHMRVNDKYRIWHGYCHMDDARMAPIDSNHFDGYIQGPSTLTSYKSGEHVAGLDRGGWHDAGDFDLRVESQAETVHGLTLAYEAFHVDYDNTTIDQLNHIVEIQRPDGKPDVLQQIEHGLLTLVDSYKSMGRFYRGIIEPTMRQYTTLGDPANITDNKPDSDDRWVFTEDNPDRALEAAAALAAAYRVMKGFNDTLAQSCLQIATEVWNQAKEKSPLSRVPLAVELLQTTNDKKYADFLTTHTDEIAQHIDNTGWLVGRTLNLINDTHYHEALIQAVKKLYAKITTDGGKTPYGVPYKPNIWGAGWDIQHFGFKQYFLYTYFPDIVSRNYLLDALNFILGCHPGSNTASFVSGVGAKSMTVAYGFNRADWSYIPGGITSGTALIRPDFPELMTWPYFWQQGEYVLGGGTTDYLFLVLAANKVLSTPPRETAEQPGDRERAKIADSMEWSLRHELLAPWYPRSIDTIYGGFVSSWTYDFKKAASQDKMIVTQARHTWVNSKAAERYPDVEYYKYAAHHGYLFLKNKMWDSTYGGFYTLVDQQGNPKHQPFGADKDAYGNAFAIYALSAY